MVSTLSPGGGAPFRAATSGPSAMAAMTLLYVRSSGLVPPNASVSIVAILDTSHGSR